MRTVDVTVMDHGGMVGFHPSTTEGCDWFAENVASENWQWMGPVLWVDHRMALPLLEAVRAAGLEVSS